MAKTKMEEKHKICKIQKKKRALGIISLDDQCKQEDNGLWKVRASLARNQKMPLPQRLWRSLLETRHLSRHPLMGDKESFWKSWSLIMQTTQQTPF